ncbi:hypothetical protein CDD82_5354 [Ophiocordyceps australis]|uniref:DUF7514 domain-containing protein n=1 Tax=Ophiocordyceps australis TaxID=1399860 RepID=A0A2C5YWZ7_9HYPO|nr:hypothetical protein CDD82_5354 [Ophiocordyceps australis]
MPHSSISLIWQVTGCQHTLQPTPDDFAPPSVPALTFRGFSRWESLEILLGPEEHVPFLQHAARNWGLKHPDTGAPFPAELPSSVFPREADAEVDRWHKACADKLRDGAASSGPDGASTPPKPFPAAEQPEPRFTYVRVNPFQPPPRPRAAEADYLARPMGYSHIPARRSGRQRHATSPPRQHSSEARTRRRSFSDYASPPVDGDHVYTGYSSGHLDPNGRGFTQPRRHSHPRHDSSESTDDEPMPEPINHHNMKHRRRPVSPPIPSIRRFVPATASASPQPPLFRPHRSDMRPDESKRRSVPSPLGSLRNKLTETVSSMLPSGLTSDRSRPNSRQASLNDPGRSRRNRDAFPPSRLGRNYSDMDSDSTDPGPSEGDLRRLRKKREEHDRERYQRGRAPHDLERDWEPERDSSGRRDRSYGRRADMQRRPSSHADAERQREPGWEARDREGRRKWERRSPDESTPPPAMAGRRYQEPTYG